MQKHRFVVALILLLTLEISAGSVGWFKPDKGKRVSLMAALPVWDARREILYLWLFDRKPTQKDLQNVHRDPFNWPDEAPVAVLVFSLDPDQKGIASLKRGVGVNYALKGSVTSFELLSDLKSSTYNGLKNLQFTPAAGKKFQLSWTLPESGASDAEWDLNVDAPLILK